MKWAEQSQRLLRKAEADQTAMKVLIASSRVDDTVIGFHAQQAAEKFLKALLSHFEIPFRRTHDLRTLLDLLDASGHSAPSNVEEICQLIPYAIEFRYDDVPPASASGPARDWMIAHVQILRDWVENMIRGTSKL